MRPGSHYLRDPRTLLSARRLDIAVKWRFFVHLATGNDPDSLRVYCWHIQGRTGGIEPGSWKVCVNDYVAGAGELYRSMRAAGFDPAHPIPLAHDLRLAGGAHRLACALSLGLEVFVEYREPNRRPGVPWDISWFENRGLGEDDLARICADHKQLIEGAGHESRRLSA